MILIAYDGSADARAAIDEAATLFPAEPAVVVTVWQHFVDTMARAGTGMGMSATAIDFEAIDAASEKAAAARAGEGVAAAEAAGLEASARTVAVSSTIAAALLGEAAAADARVIVLGSRGLTGIKSVLLGSVSSAVLHHADRPVIVIPSPDVARERAAHLAERN